VKIELTNAAFSYPETGTIFSNLSFDLHDGEILSILGPNGCGKTTLLKCLIGILEFDKGTIRLDGKTAERGTGRSTFFGYVPQITSPPLSYSVFQMVLLGRSHFIGTFSKPRGKDIEQTNIALSRLNISHLSSQSFSSLSGGERQLVLIARALATEARILLFDEPTSALDLVNQQNTIELMRTLAHEHGLSIVFTTHAPSHALHISDRTLLMHKGRKAFFGPAGEVITEENIRTHFGIDAKIFEFSQGNEGTSLGVLPILKPFPREKAAQR